MKRLFALTVVVSVFAWITPTMAWFTRQNMPKGWSLAAKGEAQEYSGSVDRTVVHSGKASVLVQSTAPNPKEYVSLTQTLSTESYKGKRIRFTGFLKTEGIKQRAKLWMEIYDGDKYLVGDAMADRSVSGTTPWTRYSIVLDVPEQSTFINYGAAFVGDGKIWADDFQVEVVDKSVPLTSGVDPSRAVPTNLGFEE